MGKAVEENELEEKAIDSTLEMFSLRYLSEVLKNLVIYTRLEIRDMLLAGDGILESSRALGINEVI